MRFIPRDILSALPEGVAENDISHGVPLRHAEFSDLFLLAVRGEPVVIVRKKVFDAPESVKLCGASLDLGEAGPRLTLELEGLGSFEIKLWSLERDDVTQWFSAVGLANTGQSSTEASDPNPAPLASETTNPASAEPDASSNPEGLKLVPKLVATSDKAGVLEDSSLRAPHRDAQGPRQSQKLTQQTLEQHSAATNQRRDPPTHAHSPGLQEPALPISDAEHSARVDAMELRIEQAIEQGELNAAIAPLRELAAIVRDPGARDGYIAFASLLETYGGNYERLLFELRLRDLPHFAMDLNEWLSAHFEREQRFALAALALGGAISVDEEERREAWSKALGVEPEAMDEQGCQALVRHFEQSYRQHPERPDAAADFVQALLFAERSEPARREAERALTKHPHTRLRLLLARALWFDDADQGAKAEIAVILRSEPDHPEALELLHEIQDATGDDREALTTLEHLCRVAPTLARVELWVDSSEELEDEPALARALEAKHALEDAERLREEIAGRLRRLYLKLGDTARSRQWDSKWRSIRQSSAKRGTLAKPSASSDTPGAPGKVTWSGMGISIVAMVVIWNVDSSIWFRASATCVLVVVLIAIKSPPRATKVG